MRSSRGWLLLVAAIVFAAGAMLMPLVWHGLAQQSVQTALRESGGFADYKYPSAAHFLLGTLIGECFCGRLSVAVVSDCHDPAVVDELLDRLRGLGTLDMLVMAQSALEPECVERIVQFPALRQLSINGWVTPVTLVALTRAPALEQLFLADTMIDADGLAEIAKLPHLKTFGLHHAVFATADLAALANAPELQFLQIDKPTDENSSALESIREKLSRVTITTE
jgi:hypothetical protein